MSSPPVHTDDPPAATGTEPAAPATHRPDTRPSGRRRHSPAITERVEDLIYTAVAAVLVVLAGTVLVSGGVTFVEAASGGELRSGALELLDRVLLVLMLVELLHTVGISIRENTLSPRPFLVVGLIAAIRRILILTAEQGAPVAAEATAFRLAMLEIGLLTLLIIGFVASIVALSRGHGPREPA